MIPTWQHDITKRPDRNRVKNLTNNMERGNGEREIEKAWFDRHLSGDHDGLMLLFDRYNRPLWLYSVRMIGDEVLAEDIVQHLWERVIRMREKGGDAPDNPGGFLFAIARNLTLNAIRDQKKNVGLDTLSEHEHPTIEQDDPSALAELVPVALQMIPEQYREILVLHAYSGYSYEEIAELLDKPPGAIHTSAWRGRKRLGEVLEGLLARDNRNLSHDS